MNLAPEKQNFKIKSALEVLPFINGLYWRGSRYG